MPHLLRNIANVFYAGIDAVGWGERENLPKVKAPGLPLRIPRPALVPYREPDAQLTDAPLSTALAMREAAYVEARRRHGL